MANRSNVLITGSGGFTGRALAKALLAKGYAVKGISRGATEPWERELDLAAGEPLDSAVAEAQPDVVVHLAGIASPVHNSTAEIYSSNVIGSAALFGALKRLAAAPRLVLVASSSAVYAKRQDGRPLRETDPLDPLSDYALSKWTVERMGALPNCGLPIRILRPFNYTGPNQSTAFLIPKIVDHFARDAGEIRLGNLDIDRDISDIRDTVESYLRLIEAPPGPALNLCSGAPVRLASILDLLGRISGRRMKVIEDQNLVRPHEPRLVIGDRTALDATIGSWSRRPLQDTLEEMYALAVK